MKIASIELQGFQKFRERETVNLEGVHLAAVVGANRAGKSTLIHDSLLYALYGKSRSSLIGDVVSRGASNCFVRVIFDMPDGRYRVTRTRGKSASSILERLGDDGSWTNVSRDKHGDADAAIRDLLGMDYETSTLTWAIGQGESGKFCMAEAAERRKILARAFGLGEYAAWHKSAKAACSAADAEIARERAVAKEHTGRLDALDARLSAAPDDLEISIESARAAYANAASTSAMTLDDARRELVEMTNAHAQAARAHDVLVSDATRRRDEAAGHLARHESLLASYGSLDALSSRLATGTSAIESLNAALAAASEAAAAADARLREIAERRATLTQHGGGTCFTCAQPISSDTRAWILDELTRAGEHETSTRAAAIDAVRAHRDSLASAQARMNELLSARDGLQESTERLAERRQARDEANAVLASTQPPVFDSARADTLQAFIDSGTALDPTAAARRLESLIALEAGLSRDRAERDALREQVSASDERMRELEARRGSLALVAEAFHESGIPTMVLVGIVDELNERAGDLMRIMGGDDLGVELSLETGKLMVRAILGNDRVDYRSLSGSEKFRIDLAVRLAIMQSVARRHGSRGVETITIDEGWGLLDASMQASVIAALKSLSSTFDIYTISHVRDVLDAFGVKVVVTSEGGTARARLEVGS